MKNMIKRLLKESLLNELTKGGVYKAFHGSNTNIDNFSDEFVGAREANDLEGPGIYFSTDKDDAGHYGTNVYSVELSPRIFYDETPVNVKRLRPLITKLAKMAPDWKLKAQDWAENPSRGISNFVDSALKYNDNEKDVLQQVWIDFYHYNPVEYVRNCVSLGIDGIIIKKEFKDTSHIIVYNPSIIKKI